MFTPFRFCLRIFSKNFQVKSQSHSSKGLHGVRSVAGQFITFILAIPCLHLLDSFRSSCSCVYEQKMCPSLSSAVRRRILEDVRRWSCTWFTEKAECMPHAIQVTWN